MATRKNFSFRYEWSERISHLSEKVQFQILTGTVAYAKTGEFPSDACSEALSAFEEYILPDFRKRAKAAEYRARAKARKAAAQPTSVAPEVPVEQESKVTHAEEPQTAAEPQRLPRAVRRRLERERIKDQKRKKRGRDRVPVGRCESWCQPPKLS